MCVIDEAAEYYRHGKECYKAKEYESALKNFEKAISLNPNLCNAFFFAGNALLDLKRYGEALNYYDRAAKLNPEYMNSDFWNNLGNEVFNSGNYEFAVQFYDRSICIDDNNEYPLRNKGLALGNLGRSMEALEYLDKALNINPKFLEAIVDKGSILLDSKDYNSAISCYEMALKQSPNDIVSLTNLGVAFYGLREYKKADMYFDNAIYVARERDLRYQSLSALCGKAKIQYRFDNYKGTINYANQALAIDDKSPYPWVIKGLGLQGEDLSSEAKECFEKALSIDRSNTDAIFGLAFYYSDYAFQYEKALELCFEILEKEPGNLKTREAIAEKYIEIGQYEKGREWAFELLSEISDFEIQCVMKLIIVASYILENRSVEGEDALKDFFQSIRIFDDNFKIRRSTWTFKGLIHYIKLLENNYNKFLLITLIDVLIGRIPSKSLTFFN